MTMVNLQQLTQTLLEIFPQLDGHVNETYNELTIEVEPSKVHGFLRQLRESTVLQFDTLIDICGVDYLYYGIADWQTEPTSSTGFSRAVDPQVFVEQKWTKPRFAVVYHLLSTTKNHRLRVKVFLDESHLVLPSVHDIWKVANWFEREAYDLYGILFDNHPDLRRILTDYGFIGHPFRKDFPLSGHVEVRYDAAIGRVIYEPVQIVPRVTVPKVIRDDNRYLIEEGDRS